jgi:hypothetical protein
MRAVFPGFGCDGMELSLKRIVLQGEEMMCKGEEQAVL